MNNKNPSEKRLEEYKKTCEEIVKIGDCRNVISRDCPFYEDNNGYGVACGEIVGVICAEAILFAKKFLEGKIVFYEGKLVEVEEEEEIATTRKYEFTGETKEHCGTTLHRIRRLKDGLVGGWIEKEDNLDHSGDCFVLGNAKVFGNAKVSDNAKVCNNAQVYGDAKVFEDARAYDNAKVSGNAEVSGHVWIYGSAKVFDNAQVYGNVKVCGKTQVSGNAWVYGDAMIYGDARVCESAIINTGKIYSGVHK